MRGVANLAGWQWLFLLEGLFTIAVAIVFISLFPDNVSNPVSLLGFRPFNERETYILTKRVIHDDPSKAHVKPHVSKKELTNVVCTIFLILL